jgi:hypothetical protein
MESPEPIRRTPLKNVGLLELIRANANAIESHLSRN